MLASFHHNKRKTHLLLLWEDLLLPLLALLVAKAKFQLLFLCSGDAVSVARRCASARVVHLLLLQAAHLQLGTTWDLFTHDHLSPRHSGRGLPGHGDLRGVQEDLHPRSAISEYDQF
jgi:hypothetical protein